MFGQHGVYISWRNHMNQRDFSYEGLGAYSGLVKGNEVTKVFV